MESGFPAAVVYLLFRIVLAGKLLIRILRPQTGTWWRDVAVLSLLATQVVLDFNRDTFVNLTQWTILAMALACIADVRNEKKPVPIWRPRRIILLPIAAALFVLPVLLIAEKPVVYTASATLVPKSSDISISPGGLENISLGNQPMVKSLMVKKNRLELFRKYWGSRQVTAGMITARPDVVKAAMKSARPNSLTLSEYIDDNVTVLLADKQSTVTLKYSKCRRPLGFPIPATCHPGDGSRCGGNVRTIRKPGQGNVSIGAAR